MPDIPESIQQRMLIPVLIGGGAMALISYIPFLNLVNCACCAGIMGGAVLGVWFYKKSYPEEFAFGPAQGAKIGALAGVVGAVVYALLFMTNYSSMTDEFNREFDQAFEESIQQMESQGQDPASIEQVTEIIRNVVESPLQLFTTVLGFSLLIFAAFGALGGAIGGKIFKSAGTGPVLPPMGGSPGT